jgi:hypothetical protein
MGRPYKAARLRFERAIAHGEKLSKLWNAIPNEFLCTPKAKIDGHGNGELIATKVGEIPSELALVLGEHLYQLRSTLDSLIYQATVYATGQTPPPREGSLEFPITPDPDEWPDLVKRRLRDLPPEVQKGIESVQPYNAISLPPEEMMKHLGRSLGILHDLARKDRHRQLHIVGSWPLEVKPRFDFPPGVFLRSFETMPPALLEEGTVVARYQLGGFVSGQEVGIRPNLKTNFGCGEPPMACCRDDTFANRLTEMVNAVGSVLIAFETGF